MHKAIIDFDILMYEVGFAAETHWRKLHEEKGQTTDLPPPWGMVENQLEARVSHILAVAEADQTPIMYYTGSTNFRNEIAVSQKYKDRVGRKPYHHKNILVYALTRWETIKEEGLEADDLLSIHLTEDENAICCSRDKDLLQTHGWHYQWEAGKQPQLGPLLVEGYGTIKYLPKKGTIKGWGPKFFLAQLIMGDGVDNIPGLPRKGASAAFKALGATTSYAEGLKAVQALYEASGYDEEYLTEQGQLLWMLKKRGEIWTPDLSI